MQEQLSACLLSSPQLFTAHQLPGNFSITLESKDSYQLQLFGNASNRSLVVPRNIIIRERDKWRGFNFMLKSFPAASPSSDIPPLPLLVPHCKEFLAVFKPVSFPSHFTSKDAVQGNCSTRIKIRWEGRLNLLLEVYVQSKKSYSWNYLLCIFKERWHSDPIAVRR